MEEFVYLLIGLAVWGISSFLENKKDKEKNVAPEKNAKQPPLGELFPEIEVFDEKPDEEKPKQQKVKLAPANGNFNSIMSRLLSNSKNKEKKKAEPLTIKKEEVKEQPQKHRRYAIVGKSEAKRAFIYSEIFNRKY